MIVLVFFSGYLMFLAFFSYSPGFAGGTLLATLLTLLLTPYFASVYIGLTLVQPTLVQLSSLIDNDPR